MKKLASTIIVTKPLTERELKKLSLLPKKIIWDSKEIYHYLKLTEDNRILLGYGDKHIHKKHKGIDPHKPHLKRIKLFLHNLFPKLNKKIEYAWSGSFGVTDDKLPLIERNRNVVELGGAASQVLCMMSAKHLALKLMKRKSSLDPFFKIK